MEAASFSRLGYYWHRVLSTKTARCSGLEHQPIDSFPTRIPTSTNKNSQTYIQILQTYKHTFSHLANLHQTKKSKNDFSYETFRNRIPPPKKKKKNLKPCTPTPPFQKKNSPLPPVSGLLVEPPSHPPGARPHGHDLKTEAAVPRKACEGVVWKAFEKEMFFCKKKELVKRELFLKIVFEKEKTILDLK